MPFHSPIPEDKPQTGPRRTPGLASYVQAEKMMQIAFVLPSALVLGWGAGWWVDHHFHSHWATITGVIVGIAAGMVSAIRLALAAGNPPSSKGHS